MKQKTGLTVFYSYAETDQAWREQISTHLSQLKRDGRLGIGIAAQAKHAIISYSHSNTQHERWKREA